MRLPKWLTLHDEIEAEKVRREHQTELTRLKGDMQEFIDLVNTWDKKTLDRIHAICVRLDALEASRPPDVAVLVKDMESLKFWRVELDRLLTQESAAGRPKLSAAGRWFKRKL